MVKRAIWATIVMVSAFWAGISRASAQTSTLPQFGHVFIVVEENTGYSSVVGSSSMPYLNSLISQYGLATNYVADTHPSIGNYMMLTTGHILTNDDGQTPSSFPVSSDNIARELELAGKTWKDYVEHSGTYFARHDPLAYLTNINAANRVDFSQFATDLANGTLPKLSWIVPNGCDDAHDCSLSTADQWLQSNLDPLLSSSLFQTDGLLIIVFDEDESTGSASCTDSDIQSGTWCGGQVAAVVVSPLLVATGFRSAVSYHHESLLRLMAQGLGLTTFPGLSSTAGNLSDFFSPSVVTLTPASVSFGSQAVGATSVAKTVTFKNGTGSSTSISSIAITGTNSGDFDQTNGCGSSLAAGASCTISVTFTPTATGTRTASVTVTDSATGSPHSAALSGTGVTTSASVSPSSLTFGSTSVGTTSTAQTATLTNNGTISLTITSIGISGDFAETNNCGSTVAAGASCAISVTFKPTATGARTGTVTINDSASNTPQTVSLSGTGTAATTTASLSPTSLTFASQTVGTTSNAQTVTYSNTGSTALTLTRIAASGDFAQTNGCGNSLAAGANCLISVTFTPSAGGSRSGTVTITDGAPGSPRTVSLSGTGKDFEVGIGINSASAVAVNAGETASYTLDLTPQGGFNQSISLSCSGAPSSATCTVSPASVTPNGTNSTMVTVRVTTTARSVGSPRPDWPSLPPVVGKLQIVLWSLLLLTLMSLGKRARIVRRQCRLCLGAAMFFMMLLTACGGGGGSLATASQAGTPIGTYKLTVTASSGALKHSTSLTLTVN